MNWISVKEQLPPEEHEVLLWNEKGFIFVGCYQVDSIDQSISYFVEQQCDKDTYYKLKDITHWMELPKGPDEMD